MSRVLVIGDCHAPAIHPKYPNFLQSIYDYWKCNKVVHIGDLVDWAAISFHAKETFMPTIEQELEQAKEQVARIAESFPKVDWLIGNHDALPARQLAQIGMPEKMLRDPRDILGLPKSWKVHPRYHKLRIDGVIYQHGDGGLGGQHNCAFRNAQAEFCSTVQGHYHQQGGVEYGSNHVARIFGVQVGCGVDPDSPHLHYSKTFVKRPVLGAAVIIDGKHAYFEPMFLEKWNAT